MIDTKYSMKYSFPHSVVHIVDNSYGTAAETPIIADDPSLYGTIVVSPMPMGEDNKIINLTRSDVCDTAFGSSLITKQFIETYGQSSLYPSALLKQGAPVKMLRVTPDGSTYAVGGLKIQWKMITENNVTKLNVRFLPIEEEDLVDIGLSEFKNTKRLYKKLVDTFKVDSTTDWSQRLFVAYISAGRGRVYNNMVCSIDSTTQTKKPANIVYSFSTIDSRTENVLEQFSASLVNVDNFAENKVDELNLVVSKRLVGSSVIVPYLNESAVQEIYNKYYALLKTKYDAKTLTEAEKVIYKTLDINTFDIIYGKYIYNGSNASISLPYYKIDMLSPDIEKLDSDHQLEFTYTGSEPTETEFKTKVFSTIHDKLYGYHSLTDTPLIGSLYLNVDYLGTGSYYVTNPKLYMVTGINQLSGNITSVLIDKFKSDSTTLTLKYYLPGCGSQADINTIYTTLGLSAAAVGDVIATNGTTAGNQTFQFWKCTAAETTSASATWESVTDIYGIIDFTNITALSKLFGYMSGTTASTVYYKPFYPYYDATTGSVGIYINGWDADGDATTPTHGTDTSKYTVALAANFASTMYNIGAVPIKTSSINASVVGSVYDVKASKNSEVTTIYRYTVNGTQGCGWRIAQVREIPNNYYSDDLGVNPSTETGGVYLTSGSTGFFDDYEDGLSTMSTIKFKYLLSNLLVQAYRGSIDPAIMSPTRCPAKYLFDGGTNTIVGVTILENVQYKAQDVIEASTIFTDDEKLEIKVAADIVTEFHIDEDALDIDVKQAMYDLTVFRCYQGIPENLRPVGPGSGMSLYLDSGLSESDAVTAMNSSFATRFDNANVSWEIGGYVSATDGLTYTFVYKLATGLIAHCKATSVNKPFVKDAYLDKSEYISYFPDVDTIDWDIRESWYNFGGNTWIAGVDGKLQRQSQRTMYSYKSTSDLIQESNMRTLSQLVYLLQNKINGYLLEYNDDNVLKTLSDEVDNMFSGWVGDKVEGLEITFARDKNTDGGDIIVCNVNVTFRGLILRVPIIVNVNRRTS